MSNAVDPKIRYETVFVFPIHKALNDPLRAKGSLRDRYYDAVRHAWKVPDELQRKKNALAVGLSNSDCKIVCKIDEWHQLKQIKPKVWEFTGTLLDDHELQNRDWRNVWEKAKGYWQRGNYLVVEFDGAHHVRYLRGLENKVIWFDLFA